MADRPYVWQMIKEAIKDLNGKATYSEIKDWIHKRYEDVNENTINAQIIVCTVNHPSRRHYPQNKKSRIANSKYDFLYTTGHGTVVKYEPEEHGIWEIRENEYGKLEAGQVVSDETTGETDDIETDENYIFPVESHLRDFLANNIETININGKKLKLFVDDYGRDGIEYPTEVGPIDILAQDNKGNFTIFELKLMRGPDKALGQILRYMGWVKDKMGKEKGKDVDGIIVASQIDEKLKYAATMTPNIKLLEYELTFNIKEVTKVVA